MYSHEIQQIMESSGYALDAKTCEKICFTSPQIRDIKYEPYDEAFHIWTDDNYYWKFKIEREKNI